MPRLYLKHLVPRKGTIFYLNFSLLGVELVGPSYRIYAGGVVNGFFAFGQVSLAVLAYFLRDYRHLQLAISLPALIFSVYLW